MTNLLTFSYTATHTHTPSNHEAKCEDVAEYAHVLTYKYLGTKTNKKTQKQNMNTKEENYEPFTLLITVIPLTHKCFAFLRVYNSISLA